MKRLSLIKQKNIFLIIKKYGQFLITSFQTLCQTEKYITVVIIFSKKAQILSQLSLKRLKNTPVFSILKKGTRLTIFIQKDYSKGGIESYPGFKH